MTALMGHDCPLVEPSMPSGRLSPAKHECPLLLAQPIPLAQPILGCTRPPECAHNFPSQGPIGGSYEPSELRTTMANPSSGNPSSPLSHGHLDRLRLHDSLNAGHRVTVIRAEGGAGKTTLISTWIGKTPCKEEILWLTVDPNRRSRLSFLHGLAQLLLDLELAPRDSAVARIAVEDKSGKDAVAVICDVLNTTSRSLLMVVDDLHLLAPNGCEDLASILEGSPALKLIALSRSSTILDTGEHALRLATHVMTSREMALTTSELDELSLTNGYQMSGAELAAVHKLTSGNLLASRIALSTLVQEASEFPAGGSRRGLPMDKVGLAVSENLRPAFASDTDYRRALALSLIPVVDITIAEQIFGGACSLSLLNNMTRQGFGTFSTTGSRTTFSFHCVARAVLSNWAEREIPADERARIILSSAMLMAEWGDPVTVVELFLDAEAYDEVFPFFIKEFSVLSTYRIDDLIRVLNLVPDAVVQAHPALAATLAITLSARESRPSRRVQQLASWVFARQPHAPGTATAVGEFLDLSAHLGTHRALRCYTESADLCAVLIQRLQQISSAELAEIGTRIYPVLVQVVLTDILDGRLDDALVHGEFLNGDRHVLRSLHATSLAAYSHALMGRIPAATTILKTLPEDLPHNWTRSVGAIGWNMTNALIAIEEGDPVGAQRSLLPLESSPSSFEHWAILAWVEGLIGLVEGDLPACYEEYDELVEASMGRRTSTWANVNFRAMHADLAHAAGDIARAGSLLKDAPRSTATALSTARLELTAGHSAAALDLALATRQMRHTLRQSAEMWLLAAVASRRLGTENQARQHVKRASRIMNRHQLRTPLAFVPHDEIADLLENCEITAHPQMGQPFKQHLTPSLTQREHLVLQHLSKNVTLASIAHELFVSQNTIKSQLRSIYRKLGVSGRDEAVAVAADLRLLGTTAGKG